VHRTNDDRARLPAIGPRYLASPQAASVALPKRAERIASPSSRRRAPSGRRNPFHIMNLYSFPNFLIHAIRACETWAYKLPRRLAGRENAPYFHHHRNRRFFHKSVISRAFIVICNI